MIELSVAIECAITAAKRTLEMSGELEIDLSGDTPILGAEAVFDSMGFINFIISLEEELEQASGKTIVINDLRESHHDAFFDVVTIKELALLVNQLA